MPQVTTSSEAGPGTKIIYCIIIHICLWWNLYMRMDNSLEHFMRVAGGTFRRWFYPDNPPRLLPDIQMIQMFFKPASHWPVSRALIGRYGPWLGEPGPDWASRALIGRYAEGVPAFPNMSCREQIVLIRTRICSPGLNINVLFRCGRFGNKLRHFGFIYC